MRQTRSPSTRSFFLTPGTRSKVDALLRLCRKKRDPFFLARVFGPPLSQTFTPPPELASKKQRTDEVKTTNKFDGLTIEDPPAVDDEDEVVYQPLPPRISTASKYRQPPPLTIDNISNTAAFLKKLQAMTNE
ncbi:hypothetical protein TNIN_287781 [Trichonephila inaurata madagascariensis]|uniref:Uncharacterized protein n=1 Tax=Trichonephila inaurata madagascariensis TaxID=2747483 RepID=A0A8X6Y5V1_9ARAC|nr:hypothetical protein TNIN_287781 [Trichonephila inaurata madagascariensis]